MEGIPSIRYQFQLPRGTQIISPSFYVGLNEFQWRDFIVTIQMFDEEGKRLPVTNCNAYYSEPLERLYFYLEHYGERQDILTTRPIKFDHAPASVEFILRPWQLKTISQKKMNKTFSSLYLSCSSQYQPQSQTLFSRNRVND